MSRTSQKRAVSVAVPITGRVAFNRQGHSFVTNNGVSVAYIPNRLTKGLLSGDQINTTSTVGQCDHRSKQGVSQLLPQVRAVNVVERPLRSVWGQVEDHQLKIGAPSGNATLSIVNPEHVRQGQTWGIAHNGTVVTQPTPPDTTSSISARLLATYGYWPVLPPIRPGIEGRVVGCRPVVEAVALDSFSDSVAEDAITICETSGLVTVWIVDVPSVVSKDSFPEQAARSVGEACYTPGAVAPIFDVSVAKQTGFSLYQPKPAVGVSFLVERCGKIVPVGVVRSNVVLVNKNTFETGLPQLVSFATAKQVVKRLEQRWEPSTGSMDLTSADTYGLFMRSANIAATILVSETQFPLIYRRLVDTPHNGQGPRQVGAYVAEPTSRPDLDVFAYARFTSPLRRYADFVNLRSLRQLGACCDSDVDDNVFPDPEFLNSRAADARALATQLHKQADQSQH